MAEDQAPLFRGGSVLPRLEVLEDRSLPSAYQVTNLLDGPGVGPSGSLRAALHSGDNTIAFAGGLNGTIVLTNGPLTIGDSVTIHGPGTDHLSISGNNSSGVFTISPGATVRIDQLTIANGKTVGGNGGGILIDAGATVDLDHVLMTGNQATGRLPGQLRQRRRHRERRQPHGHGIHLHEQPGLRRLLYRPHHRRLGWRSHRQ